MKHKMRSAERGITCPRCHQGGFRSGHRLSQHVCNGQDRDGRGLLLELRKLTGDEILDALDEARGQLFKPAPKPQQLALL